jgi:hypothetical protein
MAWLGLDAPNIMAGWGGPPQLHAAPIGDLASSILHNRLLREESAKKTIADAIKQFQEQRQSQAYTDALQKAGLLPEGDYGGLGIKGGESLADMIMRQKVETEKEAYMKPYYQALTARAGRGSDGDSGSRLDENGVEREVGETWIGTDGKERIMTFNRGPKLTQMWAQPNTTPQKQADVNVARPAYEAAQEAQTEAERRRKILEERFGVPQEGVLPATGFGEERKAKAQTKYLRRLQEEQAAKKKQEELAKKYPGLTIPPAQPQAGGGAASNLASDYGQPVSDADVEALSWAKAHPDDPRSAAILQKLGLQ